MLLACAAASAADTGKLYKWVDEKGVIHYTDQPRPGAKEVDVKPAQTYQPPPVVRSSASAARSTPQEPVNYNSCSITSPANDQVFFNINSTSITVQTDPRLQPGHRISVLFDGQPLGQPSSSGQFTIDPLYRGSHTIVATVIDEQGRVVCQSAPLTFHVRQPSVQAPNPINRPRF